MQYSVRDEGEIGGGSLIAAARGEPVVDKTEFLDGLTHPFLTLSMRINRRLNELSNFFVLVEMVR